MRNPSPLWLALLLAGSCGGSTSFETEHEPLSERARQAWGTTRFERASLDLPAGRPEAFTVEVERAGGRERLFLARYSVRDVAAVVRVQAGDGSWREEPLPAPATYRGSVEGDPASVVLASLGEGGLSADVLLQDDERWAVRPLGEVEPAAPAGAHAVFEGTHDHWRADACGATAAGEQLPAGFVPVAGPAPACLKLCEIAFDADFEYFQLKGGTVQGVIDAIDAIMNQVDYFYARDVLITYVVTGYVVRTAPFYTPTTGGELLDQFEAEWTANQTHIQRDIAHLMTNKPTSQIEFGGLGQVGVVCNPGYAWSKDGPNIVGHEVGHNWGSSHCHDPTPCNNMCGACLYIAPKTKDIISAFRDSRTCLDDAGPYPTPTPPYAHPDAVTMTKDELDAATGLTFDVLANDHDANCGPLVIHSYDAVGTRGGTVTTAPGPGPGRRQVLVYTPPDQPFVGREEFHYRVGDGVSSTEGLVTIDVEPVDLVAYWNLDEGAGTAVADLTPGRKNGSTIGNPVWTSGAFGSALEFDGDDDSVGFPALDLFDDSVTLSAWLRRNGTQRTLAGVVFSRDGTTVAGLHMNAAGELGATWNRNTWNPGLGTPDQQWVFVALVVQPQLETLYLWDGALTSVSRASAQGIEEFNGELRLADDDTSSANRHYAGGIDDVRVYDYPLDAAEVLELAQLGGRAAAPTPKDGGWAAEATEGLTWVGSPQADSYDVYLGSDYDAVRDATPASAEFAGNTLVPSFPASPWTPGQVVLWRVDEHVGPDLLPGTVWEFRLADFHHWPLDELSGTTAFAATGSENGTYQGGLLGQPAASLALGTSVYFDGSSDRVEIPALHLNTNHATFTAWLKRDGSQSVLAGVVGARDADTLAGIHIEGGDELRYHWNDNTNTWGFSSGLIVPDATWVFVALVVEPDVATLYMGLEGNLLSATNPLFHDVEPFGDLLYVGHDPITVGRRRFRGNLDDVRVYRASLTPLQIETLYLSSR